MSASVESTVIAAAEVPVKAPPVMSLPESDAHKMFSTMS